MTKVTKTAVPRDKHRTVDGGFDWLNIIPYLLNLLNSFENQVLTKSFSAKIPRISKKIHRSILSRLFSFSKMQMVAANDREMIFGMCSNR